ncbi:carbohydrate-binding module family 50 protein [Athelia psychrophila]|uniref:Carbohydrate-binding module family 50 protein n=1 Tax=Athelia psychrophila TaxID=1759441 RepID=A0A167VMW9_9AGAM|nr:carbohydrate-binding module family 50 protein [Fibularhizoctonia sp. CBS 109695]
MFPQGLSTPLILAFLGTLASRVSANVKPQCVESYRISPGDTCASITDWSGISAAEIQILNPGVNCSKSLAPDVGQYFCLDAYAPACTHEVTAVTGDTCSSIAATWQTSVSELGSLNDQLDAACDNIVVGQQYCVSDIDCYYGNDLYCCTPNAC